MNKISPAGREKVRDMHGMGMMQKDIAAHFRVTPSCIWHILHGRVGSGDKPAKGGSLRALPAPNALPWVTKARLMAGR